jgi:hypothetical protein
VSEVITFPGQPRPSQKLSLAELPPIFLRWMESHPNKNNDKTEASFQAIEAFADAFPCKGEPK